MAAPGGIQFSAHAERSTRRGRSAAVVCAALLALTACSTGDEAGSTPDVTTSDASTSDESAPPTTPADDDAVVPLGPAEASGDPDGELRCERIGYSCSWAEVDDAAWDRTVVLADEVQAVIDAAPTALDGVTAAIELLGDQPDVVEVVADELFATSIMWRVDGALPSVALTALAAPLPDDPTVEAADGHADGPADADGGSVTGSVAPTGWRAPAPLPDSFHPAGGPLQPTRALVLDAFAIKSTDCDDLPDDECYLADDGERVEGAAVAALMRTHPQIEVDYMTGSDLNPFALPDLSGYDLVHIASHGSTACGGMDWFTNGEFDPDECYSLVGLGEFGESIADEAARGNENLAPGIWYSAEGWVATTEFFAQQLSGDAIVYLSSCASADGQFGGASRDGAFVGWHGYARMSGAEAAAIEFWRLMVTEGVEFDVAMRQLDEHGLASTTVASARWDLPPVAISSASLVGNGPNVRARDVITSSTNVDLNDGATIRTEGVAGDGKRQTIPEVTFHVEGVTHGTAEQSSITVLIDGVALDTEIPLSDGEVVSQGPEWDDIEVVVEDLELPLDLAPNEVDPSRPRPFRWEVRVSDDGGGTYSAHAAAPVYFSADLEAVGSIPHFTQLAIAVSSQGVVVEGNELTLRFDSVGGDVEADMTVRMHTRGTDVAEWALELAGSYDPASGRMHGTAEAVVSGGMPLMIPLSDYSGTWDASVDLDSGVIHGVISSGSESQPFEATLYP